MGAMTTGDWAHMSVLMMVQTKDARMGQLAADPKANHCGCLLVSSLVLKSGLLSAAVMVQSLAEMTDGY